MPLPDFYNLGDLIRRDLDPAKPALIDLGGETGPREFTYGQLDAMANAVARGLVKRGYQRGDRIGILSANRVENLAAYYGIMRAGLVAVPVNFRFPRAMIEFVLGDADARMVMVEERGLRRSIGGQVSVVRKFLVRGLASGRALTLDVPLEAANGVRLQLFVHGAEVKPEFGATHVLVELARDEATSIELRLIAPTQR